MELERWATFDCFGTLVSWQRGFPAILRAIANDRADELASAYHPFEARIEAEPYRPYKTVLAEALRLAAESIALPLAHPQILAQRWDAQPVFDDVAPALHALRAAGWRLGVLTNCDRDLFARTRATLPVDVDLIVTAEDVRAYKPAHEHFKEFERQTGVARDRWVHVACSWFHDISPARALGIKRIWIDRDRTGEDPTAASAVLPDLTDLPEVVERV